MQEKNETNSLDKNYQTCYIAFLDMLGFKNLIKASSCQHILDIYRNIKNPIEKIYVGDENNKARSIDAIKDVKIKVMSDSICFYVDASLPNAFYCLLMCCGAFQSRLLSLSPPVLVRGAITIGEIYAEGDTTFGPGLTEAYLMEEKNAKYPRIIFTRNTLLNGKSNADELVAMNGFNMVYCDFDDFYTIDYLEKYEGFDTDGTQCAILMEHIISVLSNTIDESIREKYLYLKKKLLRWYNPEVDSNA